MGWSNNQFVGELTIPTGATTGARITINHNNDGAIKVYDSSNTLVAEISPTADVIEALAASGVFVKLDPSTDSFIAGTPGPGLVLGGMSGDIFPGTLTEYDDTFSRGLYLRTPSPTPLVPVDPAEGTDYAAIRMTGRFHGNDPTLQLSAGTADAPNGFVALNGVILDANNQFVSYADAATFTPGIAGTGGATFSTRTGWWYRIGPMRYVNMYFVVDPAGAGSGAANVTTTVPFNVDRTTRQTLTMHCESVGPNGSHIGDGQCVYFTGGSGGVSDRLRNSSNDGTNRDLNITGADLLANGIIVIEGWLREEL
jgi:hypothetical protein